MSTQAFAQGLAAARSIAGTQDYPQSALYLVATPIGNLADISLRALHVLQLVDRIACEDTRHSQQLLRAYGISKPLLAVHQHNEAQGAQAVLGYLQQGERVAFISDAGTPAISDPGARLVQAVRAAGWRVLPVPGASSVTAALSVAGMGGAAEGASSGFVFIGFLPSKAAECEQAVTQLAQEPRAVVLLEAPHRMLTTAKKLAVLGERPLTVGRELTKQYEQIHCCQAAQLGAWISADAQHQRGEFVLVIHPAMQEKDATHEQGLRVLEHLLPELPLKTAVRLAAAISGAARNRLYAAALAHPTRFTPTRRE